MPTHKSEDYKLSAVDYYLTEDTSQLETCRIFKCTPRSLMRWVQQYKKEGNVNIHYRKPIAYKVKKEYVKFLLYEIKKNKTITLYELTEKLKETYKGVDLSTTQIFRVINDNNITLKLTRIRHEPTKRFGKDIDINSKIKEFYEEVKKYKIENIICIDETSIKSLQKRNHCYSQKGKRCVIKTQSQEVFKKYTGIFAISVNGVVNWDLYEKGGITTDRLIEFLEHNITSKLQNKLIILDNASAHRNERIKKLINKHNNILYAVPYQHFTNSIENYFSMLKSRLQKLEGLKYENLKENIQKVINEIPKEKYENIFKGAYDRPEKYIPKNKTRKAKKIYK
jgi:transposase/3-methyladenine DNA glycosylase AlkC